MDARYDEVLDDLRAAYDNGAEKRQQAPKAAWKLAERASFLERIQAAGAKTLLELGAGTGQDGGYFADNGLEVTAVDLSPEMVGWCREKGLDAHVMDLMHLDFAPETFDAVYALNCLLHVPNADLPMVLANVREVLRPGGLFFLGVFGGDGAEGANRDFDHHVPPRFFSLRTDEQIQDYARAAFEIVDFHVIQVDGEFTEDHPFQSLTLRRS